MGALYAYDGMRPGVAGLHRRASRRPDVLAALRPLPWRPGEGDTGLRGLTGRRESSIIGALSSHVGVCCRATAGAHGGAGQSPSSLPPWPNRPLAGIDARPECLPQPCTGRYTVMADHKYNTRQLPLPCLAEYIFDALYTRCDNIPCILGYHCQLFPRGTKDRAMAYPSSLFSNDRHAIIYVGDKPMIDLTDGYICADFLCTWNFIPGYSTAFHSFPSIHKILIEHDTEICYEIRSIGDKCFRWMSPYLAIIYKSFMVGMISDLHKNDSIYIETAYQYIYGRTGKDFFKSTAHFAVDAGIYFSPAELLFFNLPYRTQTAISQKNKNIRSYIYLIQYNKTRLMKIGCSKEPTSRIRTLQIGCPKPLTIQYVWRVEDAYAVEHALHHRFSSMHQLGEWFLLSLEDEADLIAFMGDYEKVIL